MSPATYMSRSRPSSSNFPVLEVSSLISENSFSCTLQRFCANTRVYWGTRLKTEINLLFDLKVGKSVRALTTCSKNS